jgi:hypothetical protein
MPGNPAAPRPAVVSGVWAGEPPDVGIVGAPLPAFGDCAAGTVGWGAGDGLGRGDEHAAKVAAMRIGRRFFMTERKGEV